MGRIVLLALAVSCLVSVHAQQISSLILPSIGRDQSPKTFGPCAAKTPLDSCQVDFEWGNNGWEQGIVQQQLNLATRKPVYCCGSALSPLKTVHSQTTFDTWFNDSPFTRNVAHNLTLTNTAADPRVYGYDDQNYFPLDGKGWDVPLGSDQYLALDGNYHNFHFCNEAHGRFAYKGGEQFNFLGDDDVFVYINNQLAMDLGGVHGPVAGSFNLDDIATAFGLILGNNYRFDFFWCERHTLGSDIKLTTSLEIFCSYYDWCDVCDGDGQSCCVPGSCHDSNPCTTDMCGVLVGTACEFNPINCTAPDICHTSACSIADGSCQDYPIVCPTISDLCLVPSCDPAQGGCIAPLKVCDDQQGKCTAKSCDSTSGNCVFTPIDCNDSNACTTDTCDPTLGCVHTTKSCDDGNDCTIDFCNTTTGCFSQNKDCSCTDNSCPTTDLCMPNVCTTVGTVVQCHIAPVSCDDRNPCTTDSCVVRNGTATCSNVQKTCPGTLCSPGFCNATSGACYTQPVNCDDGILCTVDSCNATSGACMHTLKVCNDSNLCTSDTCLNTATSPDGCVYTPIPCTNTTCSNAQCDPKVGCVHQANNRCLVSNSTLFCLAGSCDEAAGCINTTRTCLLSEEHTDPSHWVDAYPTLWKTAPDGSKYKDEDCFTATCDYVQDKCVISQRTPWSSNCAFLYIGQPAQAGILTAGVIAGIAIAAVVFAALAGFGAKKGYDAWVRMRDERMGAAHGNPMYAPSAGAGNSALYA